MKFKEGDKVRVKNNVPKDYEVWVGREGIVGEVEGGVSYPYHVNIDGEAILFLTRELEAINENPKI